MIQTILVLKRTGELICSTSIGTTKWNETLASGFISAAFIFSQSTFGSEINDIEIGPIKVLFEVTNELIIAAFAEKFDSIINTKEKLVEIKEIVYKNYSTVLNNELCSQKDFIGLQEIINKILSESSEVDLTDELKLKYTDILKKFRSTEEILDCDLISSSGIPLAKEWKRDFLQLCLRMIDAFWKSKKFVLDQIILSYEQRNLILHKINEKLVLSALVRKNTPLGLATFLVEETAGFIAKLG